MVAFIGNQCWEIIILFSFRVDCQLLEKIFLNCVSLQSIETNTNLPYFSAKVLSLNPFNSTTLTHLNLRNIRTAFTSFTKPILNTQFGFVSEKDPYPVDALPTCTHAHSVCQNKTKCIKLYENFKMQCKVRDNKCRMEDK